jgi:hypothetical protein
MGGGRKTEGSKMHRCTAEPFAVGIQLERISSRTEVA